MAALLASTLRTHRAAPRWWQAATAWPFRLFTGLLRRKLGQTMLIACEATVELYMGLAASPQMQASGTSFAGGRGGAHGPERAAVGGA